LGKDQGGRGGVALLFALSQNPLSTAQFFGSPGILPVLPSFNPQGIRGVGWGEGKSLQPPALSPDNALSISSLRQHETEPVGLEKRQLCDDRAYARASSPWEIPSSAKLRLRLLAEQKTSSSNFLRDLILFEPRPQLQRCAFSLKRSRSVWASMDLCLN
jgi:hypothetical protein